MRMVVLSIIFLLDKSKFSIFSNYISTFLMSSVILLFPSNVLNSATATHLKPPPDVITRIWNI